MTKKVKGRAGTPGSRNDDARSNSRAKSALRDLKTRRRAKSNRKANMKAVRATARRLCGYGVKCVPIEPPIRGQAGSGKRPINGLSLHDATDDFDAFLVLADGAKRFGLGILVGPESGVVIVDVDMPDGEATLSAMEERLGALPPTVTTITGSGGSHRVYRCPEGGLPTCHPGGGVDFLGRAALAVFPPSRHANGGFYAWAKGKGPGEIRPAALPKAWRKAWRNGFGEDAKAPKNSGADRITEGSRNTHLTEIAGVLAKKGLRGEQLLEQLLRANADQCDPTLDKSEVRRIARSIEKGAKASEIDTAVRVRDETLARFFANGQHLMRLADGQFWRYDGACWVVLPPLALQKRVTEASLTIPRLGKVTALVSEVVAMLAAQCFREDDPLHFASKPPPIVNLRNGELHISADGNHRLKSHSPASGLRHKLDVDFDPAATCPLLDQTLSEMFSESTDPSGIVAFLFEFLGYCLQPERNFAVLLIAYGRGANGKTKLFNLLVKLIGQSNVQFGQVQDLEGSRFAMGGLFGKLLFIDDDMKTNIKLSDGILKKLSEEKHMTGENKYGPTFNFLCRAQPVLLTNNLPSINDVSPGFLPRLRVIEFSRSFQGKSEDRTLFDRIAETELAGVLNRALAGWVRLVAQDGFTNPVDMQNARDELMRQANPLQAFVDERWTREPKAKVPVRVFYEAYREWASERGHSLTQAQQIVTRNLENMGFQVPRHGVGRTIVGLRKRQG